MTNVPIVFRGERLKQLRKARGLSQEELADAPAVARSVYREQIARLSAEVEALQTRIQQRMREAGSRKSLHADQNRVLKLLHKHGVDWLWEQDDGFIHQILATALGDNQLVVRDGEIIGAIPAPNVRTITKRRNKRRSV